MGAPALLRPTAPLDIRCGARHCSHLQVTRVSVVDAAGRTVFDRLVLPDEAITNYNTQHSGITAELMEGVTYSLRDAQARPLPAALRPGRGRKMRTPPPLRGCVGRASGAAAEWRVWAGVSWCECGSGCPLRRDSPGGFAESRG